MLMTIFLAPIVFITFSVIFILFIVLVAGIYKSFFYADPYFIKLRADKLIINAIILFAPILFLLLIFIIFNNNQGVVIIFSTYLATIGWLFTNSVSSKNSIRQHTITVLTQMRMSTEFMKNANNLQRILDSKAVIDIDYYDNLISEKTVGEKESIRYILNYLEFVAAGIRLGDLDEQLVQSAQRGMFIRTYHMCEPFINHLNSQNKTTFEHLIATYERWK